MAGTTHQSSVQSARATLSSIESVNTARWPLRVFTCLLSCRIPFQSYDGTDWPLPQRHNGNLADTVANAKRAPPLHPRAPCANPEFMREKELRLRAGLLWRHQPRRLHARHHQGGLASLPGRAVRSIAGDPPGEGVEAIYHRLLEEIGEGRQDEGCACSLTLLPGQRAGGINAVFLAQAIASGRSLEPLTDPVAGGGGHRAADRPGRARSAPASPNSGRSRSSGRRAATATRWTRRWSRKRGPKCAPSCRASCAGAGSSRAFSGPGFTHLVLDALRRHAALRPAGPPLLPDGQPLDLTVTLTDFHGHAERLSPIPRRGAGEGASPCCRFQRSRHSSAQPLAIRGACLCRAGDGELFPGAFRPSASASWTPCFMSAGEAGSAVRPSSPVSSRSRAIGAAEAQC